MKWTFTGMSPFLSHHFVTLYVLYFSLQIEGMWQPCTGQIYWCHLSQQCSFHLCVSHYSNTIFQRFLLAHALRWSVTSVWGCYEPLLHKTRNLTDKWACVLPASLISQLRSKPPSSKLPSLWDTALKLVQTITLQLPPSITFSK